MIIGQCAHKYKIQQSITLLDTFRVQSFLSVLPSELLDWLLCVCGDICVHV